MVEEVESVEVPGNSRRRTEDSKRSKRQLLFNFCHNIFQSLSLSPQPSTQLAPPSESIYTLTLSLNMDCIMARKNKIDILVGKRKT
jgi:hypothetical protein